MSSVYSGVTNNDPSGITIPSDGDSPIKAADVNPAFQGLFDKARYILEGIASFSGKKTLAGILRQGVNEESGVSVITSNATLTAPTYVARDFLVARTLSGNIVITLAVSPVPTSGTILKFSRVRTAGNPNPSAHTVTIADGGVGSLCQFPASTVTWVEVIYLSALAGLDGAGWYVLRAGPSVTML